LARAEKRRPERAKRLRAGFRLHRLIDPETTPADSFLRAIGDLQKAISVVAR
jgi:hypothetical protein